MGTINPVQDGDWILWQLADSAFPAGGFAHSGGIEAAWQQGYVRSAEDVKCFLEQVLQQTAQGIMPFMMAVYDRVERAGELDEWLDAMVSNHVANRASRLQGQALLATAEKVFAASGVEAFRACVTRGEVPGHLAVVFGMLMRGLGIERAKAVRLFMFMTMRGVLSAAVRLGIMGPLQAQQFQAGMSGDLERLASEAQRILPEDAAQTAPLIELLQSTQDRLYSRLFQS